jgi:hypothetical protein
MQEVLAAKLLVFMGSGQPNLRITSINHYQLYNDSASFKSTAVHVSLKFSIANVRRFPDPDGYNGATDPNPTLPGYKDRKTKKTKKLKEKVESRKKRK